MKQVFILAFAFLFLSPVIIARKKVPAAPPAENENEIHWIYSIDELQMKMQANPKKVIIDMYTGWCGWCKRMDAATYTNPALVKYVNNNFYAVKFDAERQDVIRFMGKEYKYDPNFKANMFAVDLMLKKNANGQYEGQMSYPTTIFLLENFQNPTPIPGYRDVKEMQLFLTYFGDNAYRHQTYDAFQKAFVPTWERYSTAEGSVPSGHPTDGH